ncbi:MAG: hypothetical protein COA38_07585 [Fluviicola sp.]|nr:MAG: hypothetical protein COA38_07585 [Fluviicola sp.]
MKYKTLTVLFLTLTIFGGFWNNRCSSGEQRCGVVDGSIENIKKVPLVFQAKCATCHSLTKDTTGPALIGVSDRIPYPRWFHEFVTNQDSLINVNEPYTRRIMNWSIVNFEHNFNGITKEEMSQLLEYFINHPA